MNMVIDPSLFAPLEDSERNIDFIAVQSKTYLGDAWGRFKKNKLAIAGLIFISIMIILAIIVPIISPHPYDAQNLSNQNAMPSWTHWLGTDNFGRDILVRVMYGARISLAVGFIAAFITLVIGITYGGISGFMGGKVDLIMMRVVDILYAIPSLLYVILIMLVLGSNMISIIIGICVSSWLGMARLVRGQVISLKNQEFALAAFVLGASKKRILFKHLIINSMGPIIVSVTLIIPSAIFTEAFLSFVGIGIKLPMASWGTLAAQAKEIYSTQPLQVLWPVLAICLTMLSLNFIGDGLGEALDPKNR